MTVALEGGEWSAARPGRTLPLGKTRYPFYRRLVGPQGRSGRAENSSPAGFDPRTVQPIVSRYTDWATRSTYTYNVYIHIQGVSKMFVKTPRMNFPHQNNEKSSCHLMLANNYFPPMAFHDCWENAPFSVSTNLTHDGAPAHFS